MPFLDWNLDFALGVDALDLHRIAYIEILNEFYKTVMEDKTQREAGPLLRKLKGETRNYHFAEEKMLESVHYAGLAQHCKQHREFAGKISDFESRNAQGDRAACVQMPRFLLEWLFKHMLREDQLYRSCLAALLTEPVTPGLETGNSRPQNRPS
jgi:hemerythrin